MDFENAYTKYQDGVATDEETAFVEQELEKARKMTEFIDAYESKKAISDDCDEDKIRRAQKKYAKKNTLKILLISIAVLFVSAAIIISAVFGTAFGSANKNRNYSQTQAEQIALDYVAREYGGSAKIVVEKSEKSIEYSSDIRHSVYVYDVKVRIGFLTEVEITINSKTGEVVKVEID